MAHRSVWFDASAVRVSADGGVAEFAWSAVERVRAFKQDLLTYDRICLAFEVEDQTEPNHPLGARCAGSGAGRRLVCNPGARAHPHHQRSSPRTHWLLPGADHQAGRRPARGLRQPEPAFVTPPPTREQPPTLVVAALPAGAVPVGSVVALAA
jgi:hypothetical protein